jgi:hypothetical protein
VANPPPESPSAAAPQASAVADGDVRQEVSSESSSSDEDSDKEDQEEETERWSDEEREQVGQGGASSSNEAAGGRGRTEQQRAWEEVLQGVDDEFDPDWEVEEEYQEVVDMLHKKEGKSEDEKGERLCSAYKKLAYLKGVRDAKDGFTQRIDTLGGMIS